MKLQGFDLPRLMLPKPYLHKLRKDETRVNSCSCLLLDIYGDQALKIDLDADSGRIPGNMAKKGIVRVFFF